MWVRVARGVQIEHRVDAKTKQLVRAFREPRTPVALDGAVGIVQQRDDAGWIVVLQKPDGLTKRRAAWDESRMVDDTYLVLADDLAQASFADIPTSRLAPGAHARVRALGYK
jgi:hypothetical protein